MRYLPDTNTIIAFTRRGDRRVAHCLRDHRAETGLSAIVLHELYFGAFSSDRAVFHAQTIMDLRLARVDFDEEDARVAGEIRADLKRKGQPIWPFDTLIAGQALARDLIVVTNNTREFARVEGLKLEDWTAA